MNRVLITGATGFIGNNLKTSLQQKNYPVVCTSRQQNRTGEETFFCIDLNSQQADWTPCLEGIDTVVHLAARVHILNDTCADPLAEFRRVNRDGTLNLAQQCLRAGVKRFVFLSSIGVTGEETHTVPFNENDPINPVSDYAISKAEAEKGLFELVRGTHMELVIIRPPLVYGPGAPGNFSRLLKLVYNNVPLPFSAVRNRRSLLSVENLVDFIETCIEHPGAANQLFLLADNESVSTADIIRQLSAGMGTRAGLFPLPAVVLKFGFKLIGRPRLYQQLCCSLEVDNSKAKTLLDWTPVSTTKASLLNVGRDFADDLATKSS